MRHEARAQYEKQQPNFCTVIKLDVGTILQARPQILTRDLFAVANLVSTVAFFFFLDQFSQASLIRRS